MGKKKFIDKKNAATYSLVFRDSSGLSGADSALPERVFVRTDGGSNPLPGWSEGSDEEEDLADDSFGDSRSEVPSEGRHAFEKGSVAGSLDLPFWLREREASSSVPLPDDVRQEIVDLGLPDDGYDYTRHLRVVEENNVQLASFIPGSTASKAFVKPDVKVYDASRVKLAPRIHEDSSQEPDIGTSLDLIPTVELAKGVSATTRELRARPGAAGGRGGGGEEGPSGPDVSLIDKEVLAALEQVEEVEGEEVGDLEDDFVLMANEGVVEEEEAEVEEEEEEMDDEEEEEGDAGGERRGDDLRAVRLLDEQFENLAAREYEDDDFEANFDDFEDEDEDPRARGHADVADFADVLEDFLRDTATAKGVPGLVSATVPDCGCSAVSSSAAGGGGEGNQMGTGGIRAADDIALFTEKDKVKSLAYALAAEEDDAVPELEEDEEEDTREQWDCESIISTLSNLDNHPGRIEAAPRRKKGGKDSSKLPGMEEDGPSIRLTGRLQLPVDFVPKGKAKVQEKEGEEQGLVVALQRKAGETAEEKKARKAAIKQQRREARTAKKSLKMVYREEGVRAQRTAVGMLPHGIHLP